ncbi:28S ribosomal protein S18b, mitochondrial [Diaphorina citri]|uniref:Small ribosomal subunit protein mS40 n=1 Tax=Diaphorina citri TaxID=121845 RepID=A0A1S3D9H1_DIACI|nr:28S ribosomal protein S18b, mitochondrial [Diaphorina citri]
MSFTRNLICKLQIQKFSQNIFTSSIRLGTLPHCLHFQQTPLSCIPPQRQFSLSRICCEEEGTEENKDEKPVDPAKDRRNPVPVEISIRYLASEAYQKCYGDEPVWKYYRRNHKGMFAPKKTRKTCIRSGIIATGNPCPICRDEYLIIHPYNIKLLEQFISPVNGEILSYMKTGVCQKQHLKLLVAITQAKNKGLITFDLPFREYNYKDYFPTSV